MVCAFRTTEQHLLRGNEGRPKAIERAESREEHTLGDVAAHGVVRILLACLCTCG